MRVYLCEVKRYRMKKLITIILFVGIFLQSKSQCNIDSIITYDPLCFGVCNGTAIISCSGVVSPYTFTLAPGNINSVTGQYSGLCGGTYTVTVMDGSSCMTTSTFVINPPPPLSISVTSSTSPSCTPGCDGTAQIAATGGVPPYLYSVGPFTSTSGAISGLCAGMVYTVVPTDANGCSIFTTINVQTPLGPTVSVASSTNSCPPTCTGSFVINVAGGTPPFLYSILSFPWTNNNVFTGLCSGGYTVEVVDANGCVGQVSTTVQVSTSIPGVVVSDSVYNASCNLASDGAIDVTVNPSNGLSYLWNNGDTTQDITNVTNGTYSLKITDTSGSCMSLFDTIGILGNNCGTISGNVIWDSSSNCLYGIGDQPFPNCHIQLSTGDIAITDPSGYFQFSNVPFGTHTIGQILSSNLFQNNCTQPAVVTINAINSNSQFNTFFDSVGNNFDEVLAIQGTRYIPGFAPTNNGAYINMLIYNPSPIQVQNKLTLLLNDSLHYNSASVPPTSVINTPNGDSITWFLNSAPLGWGMNNVKVFVDVPSFLTLGSQLTSCATLTPMTLADVNLSNNSQCITKPVATSFDPNDKSVQPEGLGANGYITLQDSILDYHVRFQNTGNAPAQNIYILDTLSNRLDINSLEVTGYSHPYQIEIISGHILKFKFINIMLPDSNINEPGSHGYISYRIKQKATNMSGDIIQNTASIYFDFNNPIVTNTTVNTIMNPTSVNSTQTNDGLLIYPNPAKDLLHLAYSPTDFPKNTFWFLKDAVGKTLMSREILFIGKKYETDIDVSHLSKGVYYLSIGKSVQKIIIE